jgi:hypothetical protein
MCTGGPNISEVETINIHFPDWRGGGMHGNIRALIIVINTDCT